MVWPCIQKTWTDSNEEEYQWPKPLKENRKREKEKKKKKKGKHLVRDNQKRLNNK